METPSRHECNDCTFVQDKNTLFIFLVPRDLKDKAINKPLFFGKFTMTGWTGHSGFYLFRCDLCGQVSVDYPHGYVDFGLIFLRCDHCREIFPLEVTEERAVYERENIHIPKPTRKERVQDLNNMTIDSEGKGVRVILPDLDIMISPRENVWKVGLILLVVLTSGMFLFRILN